jgi:hypothetical protein
LERRESLLELHLIFEFLMQIPPAYLSCRSQNKQRAKGTAFASLAADIAKLLHKLMKREKNMQQQQQTYESNSAVITFRISIAKFVNTGIKSATSSRELV